MASLTSGKATALASATWEATDKDLAVMDTWEDSEVLVSEAQASVVLASAVPGSEVLALEAQALEVLALVNKASISPATHRPPTAQLLPLTTLLPPATLEQATQLLPVTALQLVMARRRAIQLLPLTQAGTTKASLTGTEMEFQTSTRLDQLDSQTGTVTASPTNIRPDLLLSLTTTEMAFPTSGREHSLLPLASAFRAPLAMAQPHMVQLLPHTARLLSRSSKAHSQAMPARLTRHLAMAPATRRQPLMLATATLVATLEVGMAALAMPALHTATLDIPQVIAVATQTSTEMECQTSYRASPLEQASLTGTVMASLINTRLDLLGSLTGTEMASQISGRLADHRPLALHTAGLPPSSRATHWKAPTTTTETTP